MAHTQRATESSPVSSPEKPMATERAPASYPAKEGTEGRASMPQLQRAFLRTSSTNREVAGTDSDVVSYRKLS